MNNPIKGREFNNYDGLLSMTQTPWHQLAGTMKWLSKVVLTEVFKFCLRVTC